MTATSSVFPPPPTPPASLRRTYVFENFRSLIRSSEGGSRDIHRDQEHALYALKRSAVFPEQVRSLLFSLLFSLFLSPFFRKLNRSPVE